MNSLGSVIATALPRRPTDAKAKLDQLQGKRELVRSNRQIKAENLAVVTEYLAIAEAVDQALDKLSEQLFGQIIKVLEEMLTLALHDVLEQTIVLKAIREYKRGGATMGFHIERNGCPEDIMKGQGGSVVNVLSVGLRMYALRTLDSAVHRRFLMLDEPDCWLHPDLVPRLVKIIHHAGRALGFQVVLISHHDVTKFEQYADKIYEFIPTVDGVQVQERVTGPLSVDQEPIG